MPTRSWDIRYQSRKLSEIAPKFGRFFALPNFRGPAFRKLYPCYHPCLATRRLEKFHEDIATSPEVIGVHALNFKPNFKFSRLEFLGDPRPTSGVRYQGLPPDRNLRVFYNASPKIRGALPQKNSGAKNMQNCGRFWTTSDFDREYLRNG